MREENFDPKESLMLIESMINRAKDKFAEDGSMYLLWGWTVFVCSLAQFILLHFYQSPYHYMVWMASWFVIIYQVIYMRRKYKEQKVRTYTSHILGYVWLTFRRCYFFLAFLIGRLTGGDYYVTLVLFCLRFMECLFFFQESFFALKPLIIGGIGCWILSVATTFIHSL